MKGRIAVLLALLMTGLFNQFAWSADTLEEVRKKGVLVVGVRDDAPPFGFIDRDTGETVGIDVDLAGEVAKRLGVKVRTKTVTAVGWIPDLLNGNVDLVAATVSANRDREKLVDFSLPYFQTSQRVLAKKGTVKSVKELEGKRIGVAQGTAAEREIKAQAPGAACYFFTDARKAVEALRKGEVDALSASGTNLYGCLSELPKGEFEVTESVKLSEERYRMAVRKGSPKLLEAVNATLTEISGNEVARNIFDKWFKGKGDERALAIATRSSQAVGVVTRTAATGTGSRFIALPISGIFRPAADVAVFDSAGNPIGNGKVASIYDEETYFDVEGAGGAAVQPGSIVAMNLGADEVRRIVSGRKDLIEKIHADAKAESDRISQEAGEEFRQANRERKQYQEDITKTKMMLDYQYSDQYYRYYGYPFR
jgi:polar amino acid transport system substrate-binding protein